MKSWITTAALLEAATLATFIPSTQETEGEPWVYDAIPMPGTELASENTNGVLSGNFWVDGTTAVSVVDGEYYLWIYATVHSP